MKNSDNGTRKLILRKTSTYLRNAMIIFLLTIASLVYGIIFFANYMQENEKNFTGNEMVHFIQITGKIEENVYSTLTNADYKLVSEIEREEADEFTEIAFYQFVGAVDEETEQPVLLVGADPRYAHYISHMEMEDDVFYTNEPIMGSTLSLSIPCIEVDENGNLETNENVTLTYDLVNAIKSEAESDLLSIRSGDEPVQMVFVTHNTLLSIMKQAKIVDENVTDITSESATGILYPSDIFVYVDDLYRVDACAEALVENNYLIDYTFEAFDSLGESLKTSSIFFAVLVILLLGTSGVNVFLSFLAYLKMQQKDIGILKFYGYSDERLYCIYKRNICTIFRTCFAILMAYLVMLGLVMNIANIWKIIPVMGVLIAVLLLILQTLILKLGLKKIVRRDVMYLVKQTKEFE